MTFKFENYIYDVNLFGTKDAYCQTISVVRFIDKIGWFSVIQIWGDEGHAINNGDKFDIPPTYVDKINVEKEAILKRIIVKSICKQH